MSVELKDGAPSLAEYVSDYLALDPADGGSVTAREIAIQYLDAWSARATALGVPYDDVKVLSAQIEYYL